MLMMMMMMMMIMTLQCRYIHRCQQMSDLCPFNMKLYYRLVWNNRKSIMWNVYLLESPIVSFSFLFLSFFLPLSLVRGVPLCIVQSRRSAIDPDQSYDQKRGQWYHRHLGKLAFRLLHSDTRPLFVFPSLSICALPESGHCPRRRCHCSLLRIPYICVLSIVPVFHGGDDRIQSGGWTSEGYPNDGTSQLMLLKTLTSSTMSTMKMFPL